MKKEAGMCQVAVRLSTKFLCLHFIQELSYGMKYNGFEFYFKNSLFIFL